jgi:protein SCO1
MKTKWTLLTCLTFALLAVGAAILIVRHPPPNPPPNPMQHFQAKGVILSLESDSKTVVIEHEDIPQFMPAMTMPFAVKDPALLRGLNAGDRVNFELTVTKTDSWVSWITKRPGPSSVTAAVTGQPASAAPPALEVGQIVPDFALVDQDGHRFHLAQFRGKAVLVTFVYTRCPLPNYCPRMSGNFSNLQQRLNKTFPGRFHLITISFDPDYDTPAVLKRYSEAFTHDEGSWTFATGAKRQVKIVASEFGLVYLPQTGSFTHDLRTAFIAPDGRLIHIWRSNVWTPSEVERRVAEVLRLDSRRALASNKSN